MATAAQVALEAAVEDLEAARLDVELEARVVEDAQEVAEAQKQAEELAQGISVVEGPNEGDIAHPRSTIERIRRQSTTSAQLKEVPAVA